VAVEERRAIMTAVGLVALASIGSLYLAHALTPQQVAAAEVRVLEEPAIATAARGHGVAIIWSAPAP
jgi:hypothetical protein